MTQACERPQPVTAESHRPPNRSALLYVALSLMLVLWASAFVVIRHVGHDFAPGALALGRGLVGSITLGIILTLQRRSWRRPARSDLIRVTVIGTLWFATYNIALNEGEQRIDAGTAALLIQVSSLLIALMATLILGERSSPRTWAGFLVAFAGVGLISMAGPGDGQDIVGIALCLLAAAVSAVAVIVQKPLLSRLSGLQITWLACTAGAILCLPFAGDLTGDLGHASAIEVAGIVYLGVFPTAIAFTLFAYALSHMRASTFAATTYLVPPLTVGMAWFVLGESPAPVALLGGALCLTGVFLSQRPPTPADPPGRFKPFAAVTRATSSSATASTSTHFQTADRPRGLPATRIIRHPPARQAGHQLPPAMPVDPHPRNQD